MNRHRRASQSQSEPPSFRRAFARLDEALDKNTEPDNAWKIRLMRMALFGDVERLEQSGTVKIPE